ncbi:hypothetical protein [Corynebacterium pilosum]|uniref:hypothetical protein n=1 Tax=Corynebacterium pilosum TaxID=35756 RepID=UPI003018B676
MHHITAFKHGGKSEMKNFTCLCEFHNGRNDDDRDRPRYGHIDKIDGLDYWMPAFGGKPVLNNHPRRRAGRSGWCAAVSRARRRTGPPWLRWPTQAWPYR